MAPFLGWLGTPLRAPGELGCLWEECRCQTPLPCRFLGTAGQNVSDIFRYSSMEDHLEILEWTLRVRHISPTAPDTLGNAQAQLCRAGSRVDWHSPASPQSAMLF